MAADNRTSQEILLKIKRLLHSNDAGRAGYDAAIDDTEYAIKHEEFHKFAKELQPNIMTVIAQAQEIIKSKSLSTFKLCSIGCGDGRFDRAVLEGITPPLDYVDYLGIDPNSLSCQKNRERLSDLKNVSVTVLNEDIQTMDIHTNTKIVHEYDLVIIVHAFYYMQSPEKCLEAALNIVKENSTVMIINRDEQPLNDLFDLFWLCVAGTKVTYTSSVIAVLDTMNVKYTNRQIESILDFTQHVKDGFSLPYQHQVLDFTVHAQLKQYPSEVTEECIAYLISIAEGKPDHYYVKAFTDVIIVRNDRDITI